jgi:MFS family permease
MATAERSAALLMWLVGVFQGFAQSHASATVPFTRSALGLTEGEMSLVLAVTRIAGFGALAFTAWGDRRGRRLPFLVAFTLITGASLLTAFTTTPWQFAAAQGLLRIGSAAGGTLAVVLLAEAVAPRMRAFSLSLFGAGGSFGAGLALLVLPLADLGPESWRIPFALGGVGLAIVPFLARRVGESAVFEEIRRGPRVRFVELARGPFAARFWPVSGAALLAAAYTTVALAFSTERLVGSLGLSTGTAVAVSLAGGTAGGIGFFVGGRLADTLGRRIVSVGSLAVTTVGGVGLYWLTELVVIVPAIAVSTFASFAYVPAAAAHRAELFPTEVRATAGAAAVYLGMVGSALGLLIGRVTIDAFGLSETVTLLALGMIAAVWLTLLLPETRGQALDQVRT